MRRNRAEGDMAALTQDQDHLHLRFGFALRRDVRRVGMCDVRFNFSHGSHEYHRETLDNLRKAMELTGLICAVMLDTKVLPSTRPISYFHASSFISSTFFQKNIAGRFRFPL
jgi:hypothetical protein